MEFARRGESGALSLEHRHALVMILKQARKQGIVNSENLSSFFADGSQTIQLSALIASSLTHKVINQIIALHWLTSDPFI